MQKPNQYDWKDSNLALFGSDTEKKVKLESAESELAWKGVGKDVGMEIFRINKFKVEKWPKEEHGKFYSGDSYILLNTYQKKGEDELLYDITYWIGKYSTQDEYATAAYKTVELDTLLEDKPIQHREVQGHESDRFKNYFEFFTIMKGGCDTGFRRVGPQGYKARLFQVVGEKKQISVTEVPFKKGNLNSEDVFVLDCGLRIFQFNGETANKDEKFRATQYVNQIKGERMGKPRLDILEEKAISASHRFYKSLPQGESKGKEETPENTPAMTRVKENSGGSIDMSLVGSLGSLDRDCLDSNDVFLVDDGTKLFVWIGKDASIEERRNSMSYAHKYLQDKPNFLIPITVISEGQASKEFDNIF